MPGLDPCKTLKELLATMRDLRAPGGCPWDAGQTPESLTPYILEEACETIEAIESGSPQMILDELGDLLLQIVFQAQIFSEQEIFDFADVAAGINAKLVRRHPHVFADDASSFRSGDLTAQWERIKNEEKGVHRHSLSHPLGSPLPDNLPALQRAQKLIAKIKRAGILPDQPILQLDNTMELTEDELGMALLSLVHRAEQSGLDAEQVLRKAIRRIWRETA